MVLLEQAEYGVLSTASGDGRPYGVPVNYCVLDGCIFFHCAVEGHKIENIEQNRFVSFCVVGDSEVLPSQFSTKYSSVIVSGEAEEVLGEDAQKPLEGLLLKYSPNHFDNGRNYIEGLRAKTRVFRITIDELTGKARR